MREKLLRGLETPIARREFLHRCALCAGTVSLPPVWLKLVAVAEQNPVHATPEPKLGIAFRFFNPAQAATIEAVTDQIIPANEDPGAKWAGVVHYIDLALAGDLKVCRPAYENGIERLDTLAHGLAGKPFSALEFADQTSVLEKLEQDETPLGSATSGRSFFELVRKHTLEGFFGDPKYGGNRDWIGWKILKFEQ
jgi:gluconate 2-dehydrogenase gamma chain